MFTTLNSKLKRMLSVVLALSMVLSPIMTFAEEVGGAVATALEEPLAVVFAASDFQPRKMTGKASNGSFIYDDGNRNIGVGIEQMEAIADRVLNDYPKEKIKGALFCGDYSNESKYRYDHGYSNNADITIDGMNAVRYVFGNKFQLSQEEIVMIQGNHDFYISPLATTNAHDTEDYGVYAINEKDFMYKQANLANGLDTVKKTAEELDRYLQAKVAQHYSKPIFILNHIPLHHNPRAEDNLYSQYLFDVINRAGGQGLKIFYLFGHNHSKGYDAHIGEAAIYLKPGEEMYIPDPDTFGSAGTDSVKGAYSLKRTLNFSYMNAGYVGYVTTDSTGYADNTLTGTVFAIYEDRVEVKRYDGDSEDNGAHPLKAAGKALTTYENHYLHLYSQTTESDTVLLNDKFNVSLNIDNLYDPKTPVSSKIVTHISDVAGEVEADGSYNTTSGKKVSVTEETVELDLPVAENFKVGSTGKIGINYVAEQYRIKSVVSSKPGVATAVLENGEVTVTGGAPGKTTLTIVAEHVGGVYGDVSLTYDLVVFPASTEDLYYTRYRLVNAIQPNKIQSAISSSVYTTSWFINTDKNNETVTSHRLEVGETYVFVDTYKAKTRMYDKNNSNYNEEHERWAYAFLDTSGGKNVNLNEDSITHRNVAAYAGGNYYDYTSGDDSARVYYGTYVDTVDEYAEWIFCNGNYIRNSATGLYITSNNADGYFSLSGTNNSSSYFNRWKLGSYGLYIDKNTDVANNVRRYMRFDFATKTFKTEVDDSNASEQYSNISIYKKVTNNNTKTGETAWLDTTAISVFKGDIDGETGATMYISDGINVTPVPVTLNMLYSGTANITTSAVSSVGSTIATDFKLKYDTVDIATGISVTVRDTPTWDTMGNKTIKIGATASVVRNVTMPGATKVEYTYESLNVACATVSNDGTVTGTGVGGANIRITATATYSDGSTLSTSDDVYVTVVTDTSVACYNEVRTFGKKSVYKLVEDGKLDGAKYTYSSSGGTIDSADEFLIVSSDVAGNAFAMKYDVGNMNNLNAVPVTIESHNGEKFIDTSDSKLRWELTQYINGNTQSSTVFTKGKPENNTDGFHFPSANYYYLDSKGQAGLQFLIALTDLDNGTYDGSQSIDSDTNLFTTEGKNAYVKGAIGLVYPNGTNSYMNPAFVWNYAQPGIGLAAINYNPYYYGAVDEQVKDRFTKGTNLFRNFTYVLTYDEAMGQFKAVLHNDKIENNGTWPSHLKDEYLAQGGYPGRVYAYAKKTIETTGIIIWISDKNEGTVPHDALPGTHTGAMINITTHGPEGVTTVSEPLTYGMLSKEGGLSTAADTKHENVTVKYTYNGEEYEVCTKFTLNVKDMSEDYPDYPDQGSVNTNKTLDTSKYNYKGTGVSHIDLTVSGIPLTSGIDIVVMIDASTSMQDAVGGNKKTRLQMLYEALEDFMISLREPDENGKISDVDVAIASFNGQTYINKDHLISPLVPICDCGTNHGTKYSYYNSPDMSTVNLPFADVTDSSYDAFIKSLQDDIQNAYFGKDDEETGKKCNVKTIKPSSGTNYDRAMDLTYDLLTAKQAQNSARGENREQYVIFMTDGETWQYNYFGGRNFNEKDLLAANANTNHVEYFYHTEDHVSKWMYVLDGRLDTDDEMFADGADLAATQWNTDTGDTTPVVEEAYQALFKKYYNPEGKHWMAEAIKAPKNQLRMIIDPDSTKSDHIEQVYGLGATMYTIAFTIGDEPTRGIERSVTEGVVRRMATSVDHYTSVETDQNAAQNLLNAFMRIKDETKTAGNAMYVDQMGDDFNLQVKTDYTVDGTPYHLDTAPSITLTSYPLYKYWEVGTVIDGVVVSHDMVGKRKSNAGTPIEEITFLSNGAQVNSTLLGTTNILGSDGIIRGKNVWYNTNTTAYTLTDEDKANAPALAEKGITVLQPETFYWMIGDIPEDEYVLGYDVYLEGSMEGTAIAGQHDTNNFATLSYVNHLENNCSINVPTPKLPWDKAYVGVGFYFVNDKGQPLVNRKTGQTGSFEAAQKLDDIQYYEFPLNNSEGVAASKAITASDVLPGGYKLFDESAAYEVFAASSNEIAQKWTITKGVDLATTYVTQIGSTATSSNKLEETSKDITYTNTIVYFAIYGSVNAADDTVVVDYALDVYINVMANDILFMGEANLVSVSPNPAPTGLNDTEEDRAGLHENFQKSNGDPKKGVNTKYGAANITSGDNPSIPEDEIRYTVKGKDHGGVSANKSMQFDQKDVFSYAAEYTGDSAVQGYYYANVTVIPATTVYYEESFAEFKVWDLEDNCYVNATDSTRGHSYWKSVGTADKDSAQNQDRPGNLTSNDRNNIYGYDDAYYGYEEGVTHSLGKAKEIILESETPGESTTSQNRSDGRYEAEASFSFYGTGFDILSVSSHQTGMVLLRVFSVDENGNESAKPVKSTFVNTMYNYSYDEETGSWSPGTNEASLYQVPIIKIENLQYGRYKAYVTVTYSSLFDTRGLGQTYFYFDSIRIYDPANNGANDKVIENAYLQDNEGWPVYQEVRNLLISADSFNSLGDSYSSAGTIFIDGRRSINGITENGEFDITDYANYGPNNEVYLGKDQAIAFNLNVKNAKGVHIAMKGVNAHSNIQIEIFNASVNDEGELVVKNKTAIDFGGASDLYYDITKFNGGTVVIKATEGDLEAKFISLTNFKFTFENEEDSIAAKQATAITVTKQTGAVSVAAMKKMAMPWLDVKVEETSAFVPEMFDVALSKTTVKEGGLITVTVKTSADVDYITVNGVEVTRFTKSWFTAERQWKYTVRATEAGDMPIEVVAYNTDGEASEAAVNTVTVTKKLSLGSNSSSVIFDRIFGGWYGSFFAKAN